MFSAVLFFLVFLAVALLGRRHARLLRGKAYGDMPGPWALPLIGNLSHMFHPDLPVHFLKLTELYGPIYHLRFGNKDVVVLNSSDLIREALTRKWTDFAGRPYSFVANLISLGGRDLSLGDYTPAWRLQRKLTHMAFQRCLRGDMEQIVRNQAQRLCQVFRGYRGEPVDVARDFSLHACQVISAMMFGPLDSSAIKEIHDCTIELVERWSAVSVQVLDFLPILRVFPNAALRKLLSCVAKRDAFVQDMMKKHEESRHPTEMRYMVDHMLQILQEHVADKRRDLGLSPEHIHMAIVDLFIGGTETTAALLTWTVAFLLHRSEIQDRIHHEIMTVIGFDRDPTYSDREHLPYLSATITESLRLRPSAPLALPHVATRDTSLSGFPIPKGTTIIPNLYGAHHDGSKWDCPLEFRPERFLESDDSSSYEAQRNLVPFSCGARGCLGEALARMESFLFLAHILRDFRILPPLSGSLPDLRGQFGTVVHCKPFTVRLLPRGADSAA
ncbi:steroid 21-hydroxylase [Eublepharis macularius]|uniref:Steroid 21-hydroxylase n=1 Tax=Eublepharis macularius TaxID=481883 RepID=A0AA97JAQ2_EUBMA|nr:steroid 21-hydroxylase [Eublepharis macularius]XP_054834941.1 steroid 21-hydroxylase [Eublepharis macularius]